MKQFDSSQGDTPTSNCEEVDEIEVVDREMEFSSILDIPLHTRIKSSLHAYFAKIHATVSAPTVVGIFYMLILSIQSCLPSFLVDCHELWPKDNFLTTVFQILAYLWIGPSASRFFSRVIMSFIIAIMFDSMLLLMTWRSLVFKKSMRISSAETWIIYIIYKFILPLFCPHLMAGFPLAIKNLMNGDNIAISILAVIFCPTTFVVFMASLNIIIVPRVLLEDVMTHEWLPILALASVSNSTLFSMFSVVTCCIDNSSKIGSSIWMVFESLICGLIVFKFSATPKRSTSVVIGTVGLTGSIVALVQTINLASQKHLHPEIVLVIGIVIFVMLYIFFHFVNQKMVTKTLELFDACIESPESTPELMKQHFTNPFVFIGHVRSTMEYCHPFFVSMEPFNYALQKWPNNLMILLFYARVLSFFPSKNNQMTWVASIISRQRTTKSYTSYLLQFRHISRTRQITISPQIKRQIDDVNQQQESLKIVLRRFWENILQKNTSSFWDDVYKVNKRTKEIEVTLQQMFDDYPNNEAVLTEYINFVSKIKRDFIEESFLKQKLETLRRDGHTKLDVAFSITSKVFPSFCALSESVETQRNDSALKISDEKANNIDDENDSDSSTDTHIEIAVQHLTMRSSLGRVWIGILVLILTTGLSIGLYFLYHNTYTNNFIDREMNAISFLTILDKTIYEINTMCFYISVYPMTFTGYLASVPPNFMDQVAPSLYPDRVPKFNMSKDTISMYISKSGDLITQISASLAKLDSKDPNVQNINKKYTSMKLVDGFTTRDTINQMLLDCQSVIKYRTPSDFINSNEYIRLSSYYSTLFVMFNSMANDAFNYAVNRDSSLTAALNEKMVLVIMVTLLLVTLPFVLILFQLQIQSDAIADSFSYLPNTEIRSIINDFGSTTSKTEDDATAIAQLSQLASYKSAELIQQVFTFCLTFIPLLACALSTYYCSSTFVSNSRNIASKIYTLYPAFAELSSGIGFLMRVAQIDTDPTNFVSNTESREKYVNDSMSMIYIAMSSFSEGMWSEVAGADAYYSAENFQLDTFTDVFPINSSQIPKFMSYFEQFATENLLRSIDVIIGYSLSYLSTHSDPTMKASTQDNLIMSLLYWFGWFSGVNRTQVYFQLVEKSVEEQIGHFEIDETVIISVAISFQIIALISIIGYLIQRHNSIIGSLRFYHFIKPQVLLHNQNAVVLIEKGNRSQEKSKTTFSNADYIVEMIGQGVAIVDTSLAVIDFNPAFESIIQQEEIKGSLLNDLITKDDDDSSWTEFIVHLNECLTGKYSPRFTNNISGKLSDGQVVHFSCSVIAMNAHSAAEEGDATPIEKIAIIFEDCTQLYMRQQIIEQEQNLTQDILSQVMPERLVKSFMSTGCEGISFVVQSITIGQLQVKCSKEFERGTDAPFRFFSDLFAMFDKEMQNFDLLCKARTFGNVYVFVGGLFSEINKPERHAEQAARFALKMITEAEEFSKKVGFDIEITGGVHTGGPVVAGILENQRPALQIIGPVMEMASQMTTTGIPKQIQVTRAVYELIFSAGFHIIERGDTEIRGGQTVTTYLVYPK